MNAQFKLAVYQSAEGPRVAVAVGDRLYDLARASCKPEYASMMTVLRDWRLAQPLLAKAAASANGAARLDGEVKFDVPVAEPGGIFCAGANYRDHVENMARARGTPPEPDPHELGLNPWHFLKSRHSLIPTDARHALKSSRLDWEGELAAIIGTTAADVSVKSALDHVAGYAVANDLSARDMIVRNKVDQSSPFYYDWIGQKSFDGSCPIGPWLVPADQVGDPQNLFIRTRVNGVAKQDSNTREMIFTVAEMISYLSTRVTLGPGDIILTGTPAGVGAETGEWLSKGDVVEVEIEKLGSLTTYIV